MPRWAPAPKLRPCMCHRAGPMLPLRSALKANYRAPLCMEEARVDLFVQSRPLWRVYCQLPGETGRESGTYRESRYFWGWMDVRRDPQGLVAYR